jgi:hypothetical protein
MNPVRGRYFSPEPRGSIGMDRSSHGTWALILLLGFVIGAGCSGTGQGAGNGPPQVATLLVTTALPAPPSGTPSVQVPQVEPLVGTWYAPSPDDLTFEFRADGTFLESSPNFRTYQGTWTRDEESFYDAFILDRWGYRKPVKILYASGTLLIKGIAPIHRID